MSEPAAHPDVTWAMCNARRLGPCSLRSQGPQRRTLHIAQVTSDLAALGWAVLPPQQLCSPCSPGARATAVAAIAAIAHSVSQHGNCRDNVLRLRTAAKASTTPAKTKDNVSNILGFLVNHKQNYAINGMDNKTFALSHFKVAQKRQTVEMSILQQEVQQTGNSFEHYQIHHQRGTFACSICCCLIGNLRNDILEHIREKHSFSICDNSQVNLAQPKVMQSEKTLNLNEHHTEATLFSTKVVPEISTTKDNSNVLIRIAFLKQLLVNR
ncbi:hypothetical protein TYRP_017287 [Tyrophagus putrescentiae]|nr:hypothetical protein TYRP_017287 [Tyrophagus putrescentiae]